MKRNMFRAAYMKRGVVSVIAFLVAVGVILELSLSVGVTAIEAADGDGNAYGGVANNGGLFISTDSATWKAPSLDDIAAGNVNHVHMNDDGSITIDGFNGTGGFHASGATIRCPEGTTNLYMYSMTAQRDGYGYNEGDLVGLMGMDGNSSVYNSSEFGGGTTYNTSVDGALSFSSVESAYNDLYDQGLVHVGWGNGNGLSWFCSNGDGSTTPQTSGNLCPRNVSAGYTTIETKVINTRLRGTFSGWRNYSSENSLFGGNGQVTYAMPTDELQWVHCYNPGVQLNYKELNTKLTKTTIDGSEVKNADPDWFHDAHITDFYGKYNGKYLYEWPSDVTHGFYNPEITTMRTEMTNRYGAESSWWKNAWTINRSNVEIYSPDSQSLFEYKPPQNTTTKQTRLEYSQVAANKVGTEMVEDTETDTPRKFVVSRPGDDPWNATYVEFKYWEWDHDEDHWENEDITVGSSDECWSDNGSQGSIVGSDEYDGVTYYTCRRLAYSVEHVYDWHDKSTTLYDKHGSSRVEGDLETYHAYSSAKVYVPYNFQNTAILEIADKKNGDIVYSGDQVQITKAAVKVNPVANPATEAEYATIVRNPKAGFIAYVTSNPLQGATGWAGSSDPCASVGASVISGRRLCKSLSYDAPDFNSNGDLNGVEEPLSDISGKSQMVFDANAGDYMCYAVAVYPSGSGDPTNWQDPEGTHEWAYSEPMCLKIAKKPFFGVYGGSLYSAASISTTNMGKTNIFGDSEYDFEEIWQNGIKGKKYFGSFVEQSVFGIDSITGLASGSAYRENIGINNEKYCENLVPLTMANAGVACNGSHRDESGWMGESGKIDSVDRDMYIDFWLRNVTEMTETENIANIGEATRYYSNTGNKVYYAHISGNKTIGDRGGGVSNIDIDNNVTLLVRVDGDLTLSSNVRYHQSGSLIRADDLSSPTGQAGRIPQVIIQAKNIYIDCRVTQIDAILITDVGGIVNTCESYNNPNTPAASNPLTVRGVIITDELYLYRTYGAAVDGKSGTPAETINYDTSTILWARYMAGTAESNTMTEVYRTELAPRY